MTAKFFLDPELQFRKHFFLFHFDTHATKFKNVDANKGGGGSSVSLLACAHFLWNKKGLPCDIWHKAPPTLSSPLIQIIKLVFDWKSFPDM